jgi:hypothetical protein
MKTKTLPVVDMAPHVSLRIYAEYIAQTTTTCVSCSLKLKIDRAWPTITMQDISKLTDGSVLNQIMQRGFMGPTLTDPLPATPGIPEIFSVCVYSCRDPDLKRDRPSARRRPPIQEPDHPFIVASFKGVDEKLGRALVVNLNTKNCGDREIQQERWLLDMWLR